MVVQHNITAMNANRMLGVTTTGQSKSTEKLSSGYRINCAADDAAGLSISEKMRKQIRGLSQASTNAQGTVTDLTDTTITENLANYFDAKTGVYKGGLYSRLTADNADGANGTKGTITQIGAVQHPLNHVSVIQIWLKKWLATQRITFLCRQVSLCLHRLISRIRVFFHFFSNLSYLNDLNYFSNLSDFKPFGRRFKPAKGSFLLL